MKVLVAHTAYRERGGEDAVVEAEAALLRGAGHEVVEYRRHNDETARMSPAALALGTLWSRRGAHDVQALLHAERPQVLHVHNSFPLISPSVHWAAARAGVAVVQTLHNFRLLCPQAMFLRDGRPCESCLGRAPLPALRHACYRGSRVQSGVLVASLVLHRGLGTWANKVQRFIALSQFARDKFVQGGLPAGRIAVKPNFVDVPERPAEAPRAGLLFVGRLAPEKGIARLAEAARGLPPNSVQVIGDGPEAARLAGVPALVPLGARAAGEVQAAMRGALALVLPSQSYENFPRTLVEACANALPVIASRLGALPELVEDGVTGLLADPHDAADWTARLQWALAHPQRMAAMGRAARARYEERYTAAANLEQLLAIYDAAIADASAAARAAGAGGAASA